MLLPFVIVVLVFIFSLFSRSAETGFVAIVTGIIYIFDSQSFQFTRCVRVLWRIESTTISRYQDWTTSVRSRFDLDPVCKKIIMDRPDRTVGVRPRLNRDRSNRPMRAEILIYNTREMPVLKHILTSCDCMFTDIIHY